MRVFILRMNNKKPPFDNINARKCFAHAFNYDGFIKEILKGYAERNPAPMPNNLWGYPKDVVGYDYDLKKAKAVLRQGQGRGRADRRGRSRSTPSRSSSRPTRPRSCCRATSPRSASTSRSSATPGPTSRPTPPRPSPRPTCGCTGCRPISSIPENWIGQMYDSQFNGTWKASAWYENRQGRRAAAQGPRHRRAGRAPAALRGGDAPDRRRQPGHLGLQHRRDPRRHRPREELPLLAGRLRRRGALDAAGELSHASVVHVLREDCTRTGGRCLRRCGERDRR